MKIFITGWYAMVFGMNLSEIPIYIFIYIYIYKKSKYNESFSQALCR